MRFSVVVSRRACLFYFINNLADWHYSCIRHYNDAWLKETGPLTGEEKSALAGFAGVAGEFSFGDTWIGTPFVVSQNESQAWADVRVLIGGVRTESLRRSFAAMESRFAVIWSKDVSRLEGLANRLNGLLGSEGVDRATSAMERLYAVPFPDLTVHLIISRGQSVSGGANEGPGHMTIAGLEIDDPMKIVELILHETAHLMEVPKFMPLYLELSQTHNLREVTGERSWDAHALVREALVGALVPGGCLSPLLGGKVRDFASEADRWLSRGRADTADLSRLTGYYIPLLEPCIASGRPLDADLIERAIRLFEDKRSELSIGRQIP